VGAQPPRPGLTGEELAYYRAVEDLFARLRGTQFIFSPKDFALLRRWWGEQVPLAAVAAGIAEVFERRQGRRLFGRHERRAQRLETERFLLAEVHQSHAPFRKPRGKHAPDPG